MIKNIGMLALFFAVACFVQAESSQGPALPQLLRKALQEHPDIYKAKNGLKAAQSVADGVRWLKYPKIVAEAQTSGGGNQSVARLEQPIWTGGRTTAREQEATANLQAAAHEVALAEMTVTIETGKAYFNVLRLQERLKNAEANLEEHVNLVAMIERRVAAEVSSAADSVLAQARLQQAQTEKLTTESQLGVALAELGKWVGEPVFKVTASQSALVNNEYEASGFYEKIVQLNPQNKLLKAQEDSAEARIGLAKAQMKPSVVFGYQQAWNRQPGTAGNDGRAYLALQYDSGSGLSALSEIEASIARKMAIESERESFLRQLELQVKTLKNEWMSLTRQFQPAQALVVATEEVMQSYLRQYQVGRKNWLDVLNAQRERAQSLQGLVEIKYGIERAAFVLNVLSGENMGGAGK